MRTASAAVLSVALTLPAARAEAPAPADPKTYAVETIARGLDQPWSVAALPDGRLLVTERPGRLRVIARGGEATTIDLGDFPAIYVGGQNGLMDVAPDPDFAENGTLYLTAAYGAKAANNTSLIRARLVGGRLEDARTLFRATAKAGNSNNGGRIAFLPDRTLILTLGDGFDRREDAQDPSNHIGKLVRLDAEGRAPANNPPVGQAGGAPEVYSLGHRNVQGVVFDRARGELLVSEHGPRGGDEINLIRPGANYGWPIVTGGLDYTFARVTPFTRLAGFEAPLLEWTPSIAPAGLAIYDGDLFPDWRGDLLVPALKARALVRVDRDGGRIIRQETLLAERGARIRDVKIAPDGAILVLTDGEDAELLRIIPRGR